MENAPVVSTYLTVVDSSCIMKIPGENTRGWWNHTDIGAAMYWAEYSVVEHTLRVTHSYRIVLWFMGTAEESRVL